MPEAMVMPLLAKQHSCGHILQVSFFWPLPVFRQRHAPKYPEPEDETRTINQMNKSMSQR
jgi:hypothetical protein